MISQEQVQHSIRYEYNVAFHEAEHLKSKVPLHITEDEIRAVYAEGEEAVITLVKSLVERINGLEARVAALESQLKKNSHNSSKPPSSNGFGKKTKSLREKSDCSSGDQLGHPGSTLEWSAEPDSILVYPVKTCSSCGFSLGSIPVADRELRQIHYLPMIEISVTEHQCEIKSCPACNRLNRGEFSHMVQNVALLNQRMNL